MSLLSGKLSVTIKQLEYAHDPSAGNAQNSLTSVFFAFKSNHRLTVLEGTEMPQQKGSKSRNSAAKVLAEGSRLRQSCPLSVSASGSGPHAAPVCQATFFSWNLSMPPN
jgi:hypothetical protein